jgi:hypothetical protein
MSREIDPYRITPDDLEYLKQRPLLQQEMELQGFGNPLKTELLWSEEAGKKVPTLVANPDYPYHVDADGNPTSENPEDPEEPDDEPWDLGDLPEDQQWSEDDDKAKLESVVAARNAERDPEGDNVISPEGTGKDGNVKKDDIIKALTEDDEFLLDFNNSDDAGDED